MKPCLKKVKYYIQTTPVGRVVVWTAIPATGNCFRRWSLGKFSPKQYVDEIDLDRKEYDRIAFVRDPIKRFAAVWFWMRRYETLDFITKDPNSLDVHLRPQYLLANAADADYVGKFETLESDWEILQKRYLLGPLKKPDRLTGNMPWQNLVTENQLRLVVDFYRQDFESFGYEQDAYL